MFTQLLDLSYIIKHLIRKWIIFILSIFCRFLYVALTPRVTSWVHILVTLAIINKFYTLLMNGLKLFSYVLWHIKYLGVNRSGILMRLHIYLKSRLFSPIKYTKRSLLSWTIYGLGVFIYAVNTSHLFQIYFKKKNKIRKPKSIEQIRKIIT